jgi:hypothetical protein
VSEQLRLFEIPPCRTLRSLRGLACRHTDHEGCRCVDCERDTIELGEYYMIHDHVWPLPRRGAGMLCIGCLERRIGRRLTPGDFTDAPINCDRAGMSARLRARLGTRPFGTSPGRRGDHTDIEDWAAWPRD